MIDDTLFIIPARGGSRGLPRKNILMLAGRPMIYYTIDAARGVTSDANICVSTDDPEIKQIVEEYGLDIPFIRPKELATDYTGSRDVLMHAIGYYRNVLQRDYKKICLLQPTSPMRTSNHINEAFSCWLDELDMVVSVKESKANPYFNLFEEDNGSLRLSKKGNYLRRQDAPVIWELNGAIYIINIESLRRYPISEFRNVVKYVMGENDSVDIDSLEDFKLAELLLRK